MRKNRVELNGGMFHVINRGNNRKQIFLVNDDYKKFTEILFDTKKFYGFKLYAYVLMPNHFHLLVQTSEFPTSVFMQSMLTRYAKYFNERHHRVGHMFQGRYQSVMIDPEKYMLPLIRYIHLNPHRAGLEHSFGAWECSGHNDYLSGGFDGVGIDVESALSRFDKDNVSEARRKYEEYIKAGIYDGHNEGFYGSEYDKRFMGEREFIDKTRQRLHEIVRIINKPKPDIRYLSGRELWNEICKRVVGRVALVQESGRSQATARAVFSHISRIYYGQRTEDIATFLKCDPSAVSHYLKRLQLKIVKFPQLQQLITDILTKK
ncbi:MAG: transposase [Elusimicrobiota bacterium]